MEIGCGSTLTSPAAAATSFAETMRATFLFAATLLLGCERHEVDGRGEEGARTFSRAERRSIQEIADGAARDVRTLLPGLPKPLTLVVQCGKDVIPETGENATTSQPNTIVWTIDPDRDVL